MIALLQIINRMIWLEYSKEEIAQALVTGQYPDEQSAADFLDSLDVDLPTPRMTERLIEVLARKKSVESAIRMSYMKAGIE